MSACPSTPAAHSRAGRLGALAIGLSVIGGIWLVLLPAWAERPEFRAHSERLQRQKIDADALFYSDLEVADEIRHELNQARTRRPDLLWKP